MNIEMAYKIAKLVIDDDTKYKIYAHMTDINSSLSNMINQPNQPAHQSNLSKQLEELYKSCNLSELNNINPAWRQYLKDFGYEEFIGTGFKELINQVLESNQVTPSNAQSKIYNLMTKQNEKLAAFRSLIDASNKLNIKESLMEDGYCEIGVMIPRKYFDNTINGLSKEFREIAFIANAFAEFYNGQKVEMELKSLSTTDPVVIMGGYVVIGAGIAKAVGYLIDNYKKILEIKKLKLELAKFEVGNSVEEGIEKHCQEHMKNAIESYVGELREEVKAIKDEHRRTEVLNSVSISLNKLANRIDNGFNFDVRIEHKEDGNSDEEPKEETPEEIIIRDMSSKLEFMSDSVEPILHLEEKSAKE